MLEKALRVLFWGVWLFVSYNAVAPPDQVAAPSISDVLLHGGAFMVLAGLLLGAYQRLHLGLAVVLLLLYGGAIELIQSELPERSAEWKDFLVDALGIGMGVVCYRTFGHRWLAHLSARLSQR